MQLLRLLFCCALLGLTATAGFGAETIPPKPTLYFNDYTRLVSPQQAGSLNQRLEQFERDTSNQLVVAIYPRMESASSVEDFTVRIAQSWGIGQKGRNNGAVLFFFMSEHKVYIQVGYGLEGALPDALCHTIIENEIKPRFRAGDFAGGLDAATAAIIAATKGEYRGTGRTAEDRKNYVTLDSLEGKITALLITLFIFYIIKFPNGVSYTYTRRGGWQRIDSGGSGGDCGGVCGFSGGGGSFGGGGSGGSW